MPKLGLLLSLVVTLTGPALAGEGQGEPFGMRTTWSVASTKGVKLSPYKDQDPFQYRVAGTAVQALGLAPSAGSEAAVQSVASLPAPLVTGSGQETRLAAVNMPRK